MLIIEAYSEIKETREMGWTYTVLFFVRPSYPLSPRVLKVYEVCRDSFVSSAFTTA